MQPEQRPAERYLRLALLAGPLWYLCAVGYVTLSRWRYPFELEWMEGGSLLHLLRLLNGQPLYVAPSLEFTPYLYPPFYYYLAALLAKLTGLTWFEPLRLTSLLASLACLGLIFAIVRRQTGSSYWAFLAAGLFAATFQAGGAWFDIARVDLLFLALMLAALASLVLQPHPRGELLAGLSLALAFYTKQTTLGFFLPVWAFVWWARGWRSGLRLGLSTLLLAGLPLWIENQLSGGWYVYYLFHLPSLHQLVQPLAGQLLVQALNLFQPLLFAAPIGLAYALVGLRPQLKSEHGLTLAAVLSLGGLSLAAGLNQGSYANAYLPALAGFALLFGLGGNWLENALSARRRQLRPAFYLALGLQFALLFFNPQAQIPTAADRQAGEAVVRLLRETPGEVLVPYHSYLPLLAGKPASAHHIALLEFKGSFGNQADPHWSELENALQTGLEQKRFSLILLDGQHSAWDLVYAHYQSAPLIYAHPTDFYPVTGARTRPTLRWMPPR